MDVLAELTLCGIKSDIKTQPSKSGANGYLWGIALQIIIDRVGQLED